MNLLDILIILVLFLIFLVIFKNRKKQRKCEEQKKRKREQMFDISNWIEDILKRELEKKHCELKYQIKKTENTNGEDFQVLIRGKESFLTELMFSTWAERKIVQVRIPRMTPNAIREWKKVDIPYKNLHALEKIIIYNVQKCA